MKQQKENMTVQEAQEKAFSEKAGHYLVCFIDQCPLHEQCLRWLVGRYADTKAPAYIAVNPNNPDNGGDHCKMFRQNVRVVMKRGLTQLYHEMPTYVERGIRHQLISCWGRRQYFEMRKGDRLITPQQQQHVAEACRQHGWHGPITYDGEQEDWLW